MTAYANPVADTDKRLYKSWLRRAHFGLSHGDKVRALKMAERCRKRLLNRVSVDDYESLTDNVTGSPASYFGLAYDLTRR